MKAMQNLGTMAVIVIHLVSSHLTIFIMYATHSQPYTIQFLSADHLIYPIIKRSFAILTSYSAQFV